MRIAVTGASGFIGTALVEACRLRGHGVQPVTRGADPRDALRGADAVVHLANLAHGRFGREALWRVNVEGTREIAARAAAQGVRRIVYLSSVKACGEETRAPFDGSEHAPHTAYGRSKLAAEEALREESARSGIESTVLRPPLVYGPRVRANFLALMRWVDRGWPLPFAGVANRRSLVYVGNLVDAMLVCAEAGSAAGRTYVLSDGAPVSTGELCIEIGRALGRPARLFALPPSLLDVLPPLRSLTHSLEVNDSAIRRELGWRPRASLQEGLQATAKWYRAR